MAIQKQIETTTGKILNSDIYDLTDFVNSIKEKNIDGVENKETLLVGMYGYLGYEFTSLLQNAIVVSSELANEAIPTRAKFDRNVITHALSVGIKKVAATAANMKVLLCFPEKALCNNMIDGRFILRATTPIYFDEFEFHLDYDIQIDRVNLTDSTNGTQMEYVYTARYLIDENNPNPISDIDNVYLPPLAIYKDVSDNMVALSTNLHQVEYSVKEHKIVGNDNIANKTINFSFEDQLSHFTVTVEDSNSGETIELTPVYDGLYNQVTSKFCYYQYINSNTIRIRFTPDSYQPQTNCNVYIKIYTSKGSAGNFKYSDDINVRLTSDEYTNLYMIVKQRGTDGSTGGLDRKSVEELQRIIPKESLSRGSITTLTDLKNYFNSINNENSVLHVFRKEDNILTRTYYTYCLMKDENGNVVPTNTIPVYIEESRSDPYTGKTFLESGTPIYNYKYGSGANLNLLANNNMGYLQENVVIAKTTYNYADRINNFFNGRPVESCLYNWSVDNEKPRKMQYEINANTLSYKFNKNSPIYFKINPNFSGITPSSENYKYFNEWYSGTILSVDKVISIPKRDEFGNTIPIIDNDGNPAMRYDNDGELILDKDGNPIPAIEFNYYYSISVRFYDPNKYFSTLLGGSPSNYAQCSDILIPGYFDDYSDLSKTDIDIEVQDKYTNNTMLPKSVMLLVSDIMAIGNYTYNSQDPNYSFDGLNLNVGDNIRFCTYASDNYDFLDISTWKLGEILSINRRNERIVGLELLVHNDNTNDFTAQSFRLPIAGIDDADDLGNKLDSNDITGLYPITKFLYTSPMSIVLSDSSRVDSHRIAASYYLDMINETRLLDFKCINGNSSLQYISSNITVNRASYLSKDRYKYSIRIQLSPNIGSITDQMINRTQVIAVLYQEDGSPAVYTIGKYVGKSENNSIIYEFALYTRPFAPKKVIEDGLMAGPDTIDDNHKLYIGDETLAYDDNITAQDYVDSYRIYSTSFAVEDDPVRPLEADNSFDKKNPPNPYMTSVYLPFRSKMRIYTLYKYKNVDASSTGEFAKNKYEDSMTRNYTYNNDTVINEIPLMSIANGMTEFTEVIPTSVNEPTHVDNYLLKDMVLTNVYDVSDGITLLYDYSNLMNSYVTMLKGKALFGNTEDVASSYIINRVPCVRYFYCNTEERINTFINEVKKKINYVLDALKPLECTFGLDFKFFNTYGPSNMYHITNYEDGIISSLIDNVALTLTFRAKFYNEKTDKESIIPLIKDDIKNYIEKLDSLEDIHFPNLTTEIETKYGEYLIYFEYMEFNSYDANHQHIITNENMETLTVVPEFLNVDTDDYTGLPRIEIRIVT